MLNEKSQRKADCMISLLGGIKKKKKKSRTHNSREQNSDYQRLGEREDEGILVKRYKVAITKDE